VTGPLEKTVKVESPGGEREVAVLFADIAGSTKLYEALGDTEAKVLIDEALVGMNVITKRHRGRVVKTIGDELMCVFPSAERGFLAATDMQILVNTLPVVKGVKRMIRIGFHAGPVIEQKGDVFGDTVNVAARMAGLAKGMQIMTSRSTVEALPQALRLATRVIAAVALKGKANDMAVCEVLWQEGDDLTMAANSLGAEESAAELVVRHRGGEVVLGVGKASLSFGRDPGSEVVVSGAKASRNHARIEKRRDKFYLADQSTNGTYVVFAGEPEIVLRREEVTLRGAGRIGFGQSCAATADDCVEFALRR